MVMMTTTTTMMMMMMTTTMMMMMTMMVVVLTGGGVSNHDDDRVSDSDDKQIETKNGTFHNMNIQYFKSLLLSLLYRVMVVIAEPFPRWGV